jgi:protein-tyrosine phosphatase
MTEQSFSRQINIDSVLNFRDLGGYQTHNGHTVAWRRIFRSGYLHHITDHDLILLRKETRLNSVLDLRNGRELEQLREVNLCKDAGIKYFNVPFIDYTKEEPIKEFSNMGEVYLFIVRQETFIKGIIEAMEIVAEPENHPLAFHCLAGKDRTGLLATFILSVLGVADIDIIDDYSLSAPHMNDLIKRLTNEPGAQEEIKNLPAYIWEAEPRSMALFLEAFKREYGSVREYLVLKGAETSLFKRLEKALIE